MKRYAVFGGDDYYPGGGWYDFVNAFDSLEEARESAKLFETQGKWSQIIDLTTGEEVPLK